jgi:hypothetical protein
MGLLHPRNAVRLSARIEADHVIDLPCWIGGIFLGRCRRGDHKSQSQNEKHHRDPFSLHFVSPFPDRVPSRFVFSRDRIESAGAKTFLSLPHLSPLGMTGRRSSDRRCKDANSNGRASVFE